MPVRRGQHKKIKSSSYELLFFCWYANSQGGNGKRRPAVFSQEEREGDAERRVQNAERLPQSAKLTAPSEREPS